MNKLILVFVLLLCHAGAKAQSDIPQKNAVTDTARLQPDSSHKEDHDLDEVVIVSTTRTTRTIANLPTRVEVIGGEEIDEKNNMRPANVSMLLHESTGMQVQQTSATSGNASIRIQGLDGRYTQLLKDGYPNFGNFSGGLSILEIPPLDLKQVEIIKGPASTLYGAGAIAGVINFVSRTPTLKPAYDAIINQSHVGQTNIGAFGTQRWKQYGFSLLASVNRQLAYDVDKDGFTELPDVKDFTIHPKIFLYPNARTTIALGSSFTKGSREGGDISVVENGPDATHTYFENNHTLRSVSTFDYNYKARGDDRLAFRSSFSYFNRRIEVPGYLFEGASSNLFTELSYLHNARQQTLLAGANFILDDFKESPHSSAALRDFKTTTGGVFAQHTWDASRWLKLESGLRMDAVSYGNSLYSDQEVFVLPRISALFILSSKLSSRVGGGLGYKTPTLFTEQTESFQYQGLAPLKGVKSERSIGATADVNYRTNINADLSLALNHMFFLTRIANPALLDTSLQGFAFVNADKPVISQGFETNVKLIFRHDYKLFIGYTFTDARADYLAGNQTLPLLPGSKLNLALVYEKEDFLKVGFEAYFTDRQYLSTGVQTPSFWELGVMAEKTLGKVSVFVNAENITDVRQGRYQPVVTGTRTAPSFAEIWTHTEGFVLNGGLKLKIR